MLNYKQKKSKELREDSRARLDLYQREAKRLSPSSIHLKRRRMPSSMHPPQNSTFHSLSRLRSRKVLHEQQQQQQQTITPGDILLSLEGVGGWRLVESRLFPAFLFVWWWLVYLAVSFLTIFLRLPFNRIK